MIPAFVILEFYCWMWMFLLCFESGSTCGLCLVIWCFFSQQLHFESLALEDFLELLALKKIPLHSSALKKQHLLKIKIEETMEKPKRLVSKNFRPKFEEPVRKEVYKQRHTCLYRPRQRGKKATRNNRRSGKLCSSCLKNIELFTVQMISVAFYFYPDLLELNASF